MGDGTARGRSRRLVVGRTWSGSVRPPVDSARRVGVSVPEPAGEPVDPLAVWLDDRTIDDLAAECDPFAAPEGGASGLVADLVGWRARIEAQPMPASAELDAAVAAVLAAGRSRRERDLSAVRSSRVLVRESPGRRCW